MHLTEQLAAERDISRLLIEYAYIVDGKDYARLHEIFSDDVEHHYGLTTSRGIDSLKAMVAGYIDRCGPTQHLLGSTTIDVLDEHTATSRTYVQARHRGRGLRRRHVFDISGTYVDKWARSGTEWRIVHRQAEWRIMFGNVRALFGRRRPPLLKQLEGA
ncbi:nuclear transport factor 2 family protein [Curtobacterium flaccumfaciens]|uniref:nuclear transport factor 2 family protein n=1 Tax=Curtobacterium flaccumfaciens TaxID=2035 RepID=UPI001E3D81DA|nr:nuclear transport factor 2 family protein [Curtobacterium allii]MCE0459475.1 nuclear transport factor 2 family protein [Curtobacterium allii]